MQRLPEDIPHREALIKAGFTNYAVLVNHKSMETIRGIGAKRAKEIRAYINGESESSADYTISELRDMDLSDKDESFFKGDERASIDQFK